MDSLKEISQFLVPNARLDLKAVAVSYVLSNFNINLNLRVECSSKYNYF